MRDMYFKYKVSGAPHTIREPQPQDKQRRKFCVLGKFILDYRGAKFFFFEKKN